MNKRRLILEEDDENPEFQETQNPNRRIKTNWFSVDADWVQKHFALVENAIRPGVQEAVEQTLAQCLQPNTRSLPYETKLSASRKFKLKFEGQFPHKLFTGNPVKAKDSSPLEVVLLDSISGKIATDHPLSSAKVEIEVLYGQFKKVDMLEDWTEKEFNDNIVPPRAHKGPLLVGECVISLRNGTGFFNEIKFTDNSSWVRSKKFRLGVRIHHKLANGNQVQEAVSCSFKVKHRRGESYEKHSTPSPDDKVWRLDGVSKDGKICTRLQEKQIYTVKHLVDQYNLDQSSLKNVVGCTKTWKKILQQIKTFFPSDEKTNLSNPVIPSHVQFDSLATSQGVNIVHANPIEAQIPNAPNNMETSHGFDQLIPSSIEPGNDMEASLMIQELLDGPSSSSGPRMFNDDLNSNFCQSTLLEKGNCPFLDATATATATAKMGKERWSKIRVGWRTLIKWRNAATIKQRSFSSSHVSVYV